jgi:hypothetical protein
MPPEPSESKKSDSRHQAEEMNYRVDQNLNFQKLTTPVVKEDVDR